MQDHVGSDISLVALTGATGHLGQNLLRYFQENGQAVRSVVRSNPSWACLGTYSEVVWASLDNVEELTKAFEAVDVVIHCAAYIGLAKSDKNQLFQSNVQGTQNVVDACQKAGVKRLLYIGSVESFANKKRGETISEKNAWVTQNHLKKSMTYGLSKAMASQIVLEAGKNSELEVLVLCPTGAIGPHDLRQGSMTKSIVSFLNKKLPFYLSGGADHVDTRDVSASIFCALRQGESGNVYLLGGKYCTLKDFFKHLEEASGISAPRFKFPHALAMSSAFLEEWFASLFKRVPLFTPEGLSILAKEIHVDSSKAATDLGHKSRPIKETIEAILSCDNLPYELK